MTYRQYYYTVHDSKEYTVQYRYFLGCRIWFRERRQNEMRRDVRTGFQIDVTLLAMVTH